MKIFNSYFICIFAIGVKFNATTSLAVRSNYIIIVSNVPTKQFLGLLIMSPFIAENKISYLKLLKQRLHYC